MDKVDIALLSIEPPNCKTCGKLLKFLEEQSDRYGEESARLRDEIMSLEAEVNALEDEINDGGE